MSESFTFPSFYHYPPFYTLQPVAATRERQCRVWGTLILSYCRHHKIYVLHVGGSDDLELFNNQSIERKLSPESKRAFFQWLVERGNGLWRDPDQQSLLVLWKTVPQWAETLLQWVYQYGLEDSVLTVDEITHGDETSGTELDGLDKELIIHMINLLEKQGKAKLFQGSSQDDIGIKFFKQVDRS